MNTARKGDVAELRVAADLVERGYQVMFPFGPSHDYDLIVDRGSGLERVQAKYAEVKKGVIPVRTRSHSNTSAKQIQKNYTSEEIDWLAVYEPRSELICYIPASELGGALLHLRVEEPLRKQPTIRWAKDYMRI